MAHLERRIQESLSDGVDERYKELESLITEGDFKALFMNFILDGTKETQQCFKNPVSQYQERQMAIETAHRILATCLTKLARVFMT